MYLGFLINLLPSPYLLHFTMIQLKFIMDQPLKTASLNDPHAFDLVYPYRMCEILGNRHILVNLLAGLKGTASCNYK